jgi:hypothetical protein
MLLCLIMHWKLVQASKNTNRISILEKSGLIADFPLKPKPDVADEIVAVIHQLLSKKIKC